MPPHERHGVVPAPADGIRLMIVSDVRLYREGIAASLAHRERLTIAGVAASCADALGRVAEGGADIIVLDMAARGSLDFVREMASAESRVRIIAFAVEDVERDILLCAEAGAAGYVSCDGSVEDLVATIRSVARGELVCSPRVAATLFRALHTQTTRSPADHASLALTAREREIAPLLERGLSNKEIAARLHIEVATVKNHVHNLLEKLQVASRGEAAARLRGMHGAPSGRLRLDDRRLSGERPS